MMNRSVVIYFSKFGNTRTTAETIADTLASTGPVRLLNANQMSERDIKDADLIVVGTPTHKMNLPEAVRPVFDHLPKGCLKGIQTAAFDTSYKMSNLMSRFTAAKLLNRKLRKFGGKAVVPPETFFVVGREGPLYEGEIERAKDWAKQIINRR